MFKEMTLLVIVLWGSQGMPTTTPQKQNLSGLSELYCKAEALLREYKSIDSKFLPSHRRSDMASVFSQPGCNFTQAAEECQTMRAFHALFLWLNSTYPQDGLLEPVMGSFNLLIQLQESYVNNTCLGGASDNVPEITCPTYPRDKPELENKFYYVFELYRNHIYNFWSSKLTEKQRNVTDVCGAQN